MPYFSQKSLSYGFILHADIILQLKTFYELNSQKSKLIVYLCLRTNATHFSYINIFTIERPKMSS